MPPGWDDIFPPYLYWQYGSGFPKGKGCLKPAYEPVLLCRKPGPKVLELGIDECRVPTDEDRARPPRTANAIYGGGHGCNLTASESHPVGRWPANVLHDGSDEVLEAFAAYGDTGGGFGKAGGKQQHAAFGGGMQNRGNEFGFGDSGTAARFFYCAKADASERWGDHPTVKPLALMRWLINLVSRPGETILDPFVGSGSTIEAAKDRHCIGIEKDPGYYATALRRLRHAAGKSPDQLFSVLEETT